MLTFSLVIIIPPIIDYFFTLGAGLRIAYFYPTNIFDLLINFISFFAFINESVTIGIKVELLIILFLLFYYFSIKKLDFYKKLFGILLVYILFILYFILPTLVNTIFNYLSITLKFFDIVINLYLFLISIQLFFLFILKYKKTTNYIFKDFRFIRLFHFELMFLFGLLFSGINLFSIAFEIIVLFFSIVFAWEFSVISNNIFDLKIDRISNKLRPIQKGVNLSEYILFMFLFFILSILLSFTIGYMYIFFILVFIGNYFIYSIPPLRLKRVPIFSKFLIAVNSFVLFVLGTTLGGLNFNQIPSELVFFFLIGFTLVINFIDIKDYLGDKKNKILTLPVIFGEKKSKKLISLFFVIVYIWAIFLMSELFLIIPTLLLLLIQIYTIMKKEYDEKLVFIIYLISFIIFIYFYIN